MRNFPNEEKLKDEVGFSSAGEDFARIFDGERWEGRRSCLSWTCVEMQFCVAEEGRLFIPLLPHLIGIVPQIDAIFPLSIGVCCVCSIRNN